MIDESLISNISFTNKSYNEIFSEILDLFKKLTNTYDPSQSNESDPGVVLSKTLAIVADKLNYNIDKNVLELFPLSVTQEINARRLYDSLGYQMAWYRSSRASVDFSLKSDRAALTSLVDQVVIPKFTQLRDDTNSVFYVLTQEVALSTGEDVDLTLFDYPALEGQIKDYLIDNQDRLYYQNLDSNNRLYFPEKNIAENGIFVTLGDGDSWDFRRVNNLLAASDSRLIYKFGIDIKTDKCYIEFDQDFIKQLLQNENYFRVKYILTNGENGNIPIRTLTGIVENIVVGEGDDTVVANEYINVIQINPSQGGSNPESINSAYTNYKRVVGTFETLVTLRDYNNAFFNLLDQFGTPYVSNVIVSDTSVDFNLTTKIRELLGSVEKLSISRLGDFDTNSLILYLLKQSTDYDETFTPVVDDLVLLQTLKAEVENLKSIQHHYLDPKELSSSRPIVYFFRNNYDLIGNIVTKNNVTSTEASSIKKNVDDALKEVFNARDLTFGQGVDYNLIVETIVGADPRIRTAFVNNLKYLVDACMTENTSEGGWLLESPLSSITKASMVARMILSGNIQLLKFEDTFDYEFGREIQTQTIEGTLVPINDLKISSITTDLNIVLPSSESSADVPPYTLQENENILLFRDLYVTSEEYSNYVKFNFYYDIGDPENPSTPPSIELNKDFELPVGSKILLQWQSTSGSIDRKLLLAGTIINVNKTIITTGVVSGVFNSITKDYAVSNDEWQHTLSNGQWLKTKVKNQYRLKSDEQVYYMGPSGEISLNVGEQKILSPSEFFIRIDSNSRNLIIYGSGTVIQNAGTNPIYESFDQDINNEDLINSNNISALRGFFKTVVNGQDLVVKEQELVLLGKGCQVICNGPSDLYPERTISSQSLDAIDGVKEIKWDLTYIDNTGETNTLFYDEDGFNNWYVLTRLDINSFKNNHQKVVSQDYSVGISSGGWKSTQTIILNFQDPNGKSIITSTPSESKYVMFSDSLYLIGGREVKIEDDLSALVYLNNASWEFLRDRNGLYTFKGEFQHTTRAEIAGFPSSISSTSDPILIDAIPSKFPLKPSIVPGSISLRIEGQNLQDNGAGGFVGREGFEVNYDTGEITFSPARPAFSRTIINYTYKLNELDIPFNFVSKDNPLFSDGTSTPSTEDSQFPKMIWLIPVTVSLNSPNGTYTIEDNKFDNMYKILNSDLSISNHFNDGVFEKGENITSQYFIATADPSAELTIIHENIGPDDYISLGKPMLVESFNTSEIDSTVEVGQFDYYKFVFDNTDNNVISQMAVYDTDFKYNWSYRVRDSQKVLQPGVSESFFNLNHIANNWTIPKIKLNSKGETRIRVSDSNIKD